MKLRPRRREDPELNLVPMIDVVLVLLIFFMLATSFRPRSSLELQLPEAAAGPPAPGAATRLEVEIDAAGHYAINGQTLGATGVEALKTALQNATTQPALPLIINADGRTPHQAVVAVLDAAARLGWRQLDIATVNAPPIAPATLAAPTAPTMASPP